MTQYHVAVVEGRHQVYATETGIDRTYLGPRFEQPRDAINYSNELAGLPGRRRTPDLARVGISTESRDEVAVPIEAPGGLDVSPRTCVVCGRDLPPGSRPQRRTDSDRCRRALTRQDAAKALAAGAQGGSRSVSQFRAAPEGLSPATPDPTSPADPGGCALPGSAEDAGPDLSPGHHPPGVLGLGL